MIVVDASAMTEFLLQTPRGRRVETRLFRDDDELHVPHLLDVEVLQALRRLVRTRELSADRAEEAIADHTSESPAPSRACSPQIIAALHNTLEFVREQDQREHRVMPHRPLLNVAHSA